MRTGLVIAALCLAAIHSRIALGQAAPIASSPWQQVAYAQPEPQNRLFDEAIPADPLFDANQTWMGDQLLAPDLDPAGFPVPPENPFAYRTDYGISWTPGSADDFGLTEFDIRSFPSARPTGSLAVGVTPAVGIRLLDGPVRTDLPHAIYDLSLDITGLWKTSETWSWTIGVSPGWYSDFENKSHDAFRIPSRFLAIYNYSPSLQLLFGVVYFDREDVSWLPAAGLVYTPSDEAKLELLFPRPRILRRVYLCGPTEGWLYTGSEFGGGSWAIRRADGTDDVFTYSLFRLLIGYEQRNKPGISSRVEVGYTFGRQIEYRSNIGNYDPSGAFLLRAGVTF